MIFYTSDLHFGYDKILTETGRPFANLHEMDQVIIENWNRVVTPEDTVYVLGDLGGHNEPLPHRQLSALAGHKHLIRGNHDVCIPEQQKLFDYFETISDYLEINDHGFYITLCHYPIVYLKRGYMIHGHIHNTTGEIYQVLKQLPRVMNAGVDVNQFSPVTLEELVYNNQSYYQDPDRGKTPDEMWSPTCKFKWEPVFLPVPNAPENIN